MSSNDPKNCKHYKQIIPDRSKVAYCENCEWHSKNNKIPCSLERIGTIKKSGKTNEKGVKAFDSNVEVINKASVETSLF